MSEYATLRKAALDTKITELRSEGWDVVARAERDLALMQRDEARDLVDKATEVILDALAWLPPHHCLHFMDTSTYGEFKAARNVLFWR